MYVGNRKSKALISKTLFAKTNYAFWTIWKPDIFGLKSDFVTAKKKFAETLQNSFLGNRDKPYTWNGLPTSYLREVIPGMRIRAFWVRDAYL